MRDLTWKKLDQKVESSGEYLLSSFHCECERCPHWAQCSWGMREKQNDQRREDMQVFPEVLFQSIAVVVELNRKGLPGTCRYQQVIVSTKCSYCLYGIVIMSLETLTTGTHPLRGHSSLNTMIIQVQPVRPNSKTSGVSVKFAARFPSEFKKVGLWFPGQWDHMSPHQRCKEPIVFVRIC